MSTIGPGPAPLAPDPDWQERLESVNRGPDERTALERHVDFFDTNKDNQLSVKEVRKGLEKLGMDSWVERVFASTVNNVLLGPPTRDRLFTFKVDIANIEKARHEGSNTGIFGPAGEFVPAKFEEMFAKFDRDSDGRLTATEIKAMVAENTAGVTRGRGKFSAEAEFNLLIKLLAYEDDKGERYVTKPLMLRFYDGTLFDEVAAEVKLLGKAARKPLAEHDPARAGGAVPAAAARGAGPAAGPAAGAAFGDALLSGADAAAGAEAATAALGGMLAVCPYAGQLAGAGAENG